MRPIFLLLMALFVLLQYQLWFAPGGIKSAHALHRNIQLQVTENKTLSQRNAILLSDIQDLKQSNQAIEAHARNDLGMIKDGEVFYQVVK